MRCLSCNAALTDYEATRKSALTNTYIDLCNHCFSTVSDDILTIDREDLVTDETEEVEDTSHCGMDAGVDNHD